MRAIQQATISQPRRPSIADPYQDLLADLDENYRAGLVRRLAIGFYEDWQPTRKQLAVLIEEETGRAVVVDDAAAHGTAGSGIRVPPPPVTAAPPIRPSAETVTAARPARAHAGRLGRLPPDQPTIATFDVDCGELAPDIRFVARSLTSAGIAHRDGVACRMIFLNYQLLPLSRAPARPPAGAVIFSAPISYLPDGVVPRADADGQVRRHAVGQGATVGSRGSWPLAESVRWVNFLIASQAPIGVPTQPEPAGSLLVNITSGRAVWRTAKKDAQPGDWMAGSTRFAGSGRDLASH